MGIFIAIGDGQGPFGLGFLQDEPAFDLSDEYEYAFLYPLLEKLRARSGQFVDWYGFAQFTGPELDDLDNTLSEAYALVEAQPGKWLAHNGTPAQPGDEGTFEILDRAGFLERLEQWRRIIKRARELKLSVICLGD